MPSDVAHRLLAKYESQIGDRCAIPGTRFGRDMPSSVMRQLNIKFYADIKRQRQQHGRRIRVLVVLGELRYLIRECGASGDRSGRVFVYLEQLNRLYIEQLQDQTPPPVLLLRSGTCITLETGGTGKRRRTTVSVVDGAGRPQIAKRPVPFTLDNATGSRFDRTLYSKKTEHGVDAASAAAAAKAIDPWRPCWVDYLVDDLSETEAHGLFRLVAQSRVPEQTQSRYRAAIEEALAFALSRKGCALQPLESMRVCAYFIRHHRSGWARKIGVTSDVLERILVLWRAVGRQCVAGLRAGGEHDPALDEIQFKRWNNVASEAIAWRARKTRGLPTAWALICEWHATWIQAMPLLCTGRRRGFASGEDPYSSPFWRSKQPGRLRLHELTLSDKVIENMLKRLADAGMPDRAAELLGLATSEAGVPLSGTMFSVVIHGLCAGHRRVIPQLPSLAKLPLVNRQAPGLYRPQDGDSACGDRALATMVALLHGMVRWDLVPTRYALFNMTKICCAARSRRHLREVLEACAARWGLTPSKYCWYQIDRQGMCDDAPEWVGAALAARGSDGDGVEQRCARPPPRPAADPPAP